MMRQFQAIAAPLLLTIILDKPVIIYALTGVIVCRNHHATKLLENRYCENLLFWKSYHNLKTKLCMESDDGDIVASDSADSGIANSNHHQPTKEIPMLRRHKGGRRKNLRRTNEKSTILSATTSMLSKYRKFVLWLASAALLWVIFFSRFFGGTGPSPNFVYYQSSVIELRVISPDGYVETSRKESFKSNLPDLVRQQRQNTEGTNNMNEVELRRFDEQFRKNDEQMRRAKDEFF